MALDRPKPSEARGAATTIIASVILFCISCNNSPTPTPSTTASPRAPAGKVEWVKLPRGVEASAFVRSEMQRALGDKKKLVIYVGAASCEPCRRFHEAADAHALDAAFGDLRFIDLDHEEDEAALVALSCESQMIPLFALPTGDGRCSDRRVEGGIKGDGAVAYMSPRLRTLVGPWSP